MASRMEKMTCSGPKLAQRCRQMKEMIETTINGAIRAEPTADMRLDDVSVTSVLVSVAGSELVCNLAAAVFRKAGLVGVEVYPYLDRPDAWMVNGIVRT